MKKSLSSSSLPQLSHPAAHVATHPMRRNISTGALSSLDVDMYQHIPIITHELEYLASKVPIHKVVGCTIQSSLPQFPNAIIAGNDIKDFATCIAEPCEIESNDKGNIQNLVQQPRYNWLERASYQEDVQERYFNLYSRIRRRNKK
jgi:hypothetical protein